MTSGSIRTVDGRSRWIRGGAGVDAAVAAMSFWVAVTAVAAMFVVGVRPCLRRVRYAAWDREIASLADDGGPANRRS
ncbi:hypothetical protein [Mycolicibacterium sp. XJ1904]